MRNFDASANCIKKFDASFSREFFSVSFSYQFLVRLSWASINSASTCEQCCWA